MIVKNALTSKQKLTYVKRKKHFKRRRDAFVFSQSAQSTQLLLDTVRVNVVIKSCLQLFRNRTYLTITDLFTI